MKRAVNKTLALEMLGGDNRNLGQTEKKVVPVFEIK